MEVYIRVVSYDDKSITVKRGNVVMRYNIQEDLSIFKFIVHFTIDFKAENWKQLNISTEEELDNHLTVLRLLH
jgi:hypothetical protein